MQQLLKPNDAFFNEKEFLENLLLDEDRAIYLSFNNDQKSLVRKAWRKGWLDYEKSNVKIGT